MNRHRQYRILLGLLLALATVVAVTQLQAARVPGAESEDDTGSATPQSTAPAYATTDAAKRGLLSAADSFIGTVTRNVPGTARGTKACAWSVSRMLENAGLVEDGFAENAEMNNRLVPNLVNNLKTRGWSEISDRSVGSLQPGDIIVWGPSRHVGVVWGDGMAISNQSGRGEVKRHPILGWYSGWSRIVTVLRYTGRTTAGSGS